MEFSSELPVGVRPLDSQGGGHKFGAKKGMIGIMADTDGCILKPLCSRLVGESDIELEELHFYQHVFSENNSCRPAVDEGLRRLMPTFHGTQLVRIAGQDVECLKLQDLTHGFRRVCVLDVKIGRVTSMPDATDAKRIHEAGKYLGTRKPFGFSVPGMTYHDLSSGQTVKLDKAFGKQLNATNIVEALCQFLNVSYCAHCASIVCARFIADLTEIAFWFRHQCQYRFFASSVLLIYDAATYEKCSLEAHTVDLVPRNVDISHCIIENRFSLVDISRDDQSAPFSVLSANESPRSITQNGDRLAGVLYNDQSDSLSSNKNDQLASRNGQSINGVRNNKIAAHARMVDFAHVQTVSDSFAVDENYLQGLLSLISMLDTLRKHLTHNN